MNYIENFFKHSDITRDFEKLAEKMFAASKPYLPYNITRNKKTNEYMLEMSVAGYTKDNITAELVNGTLKITGKTAKPNEDLEFKINNLSHRSFQFLFPIDPVLEISEITLKDGVLKVIFKQNELPSFKKLLEIKAE